ncbi:MAG: nucleotidyltransferase family protein [Chloroflexota bacterium]
MSLIAGNVGFIQRLFDEQQVTWAVCAGAAAHLYGNRRPIQDVDILVSPGQLKTIIDLLRTRQKTVQCDGQRIIWRSIKFFDDLSIRQGSSRYPFELDEAMIAKIRRMPLLGANVSVLAPEDVLIHKLLLRRGEAQGKHDVVDAAGIARRQQIDYDYLHHRIKTMEAEERANEALGLIDLTYEVV